MGADLISMTIVVDERRSEHCTIDAIKQHLADGGNVRRILDGSAYLREQVEEATMWDEISEPDTQEVEAARAILVEGAESLIEGFRTHNAIPMGHGLLLIVSGGMSWGDEPYEGFTSESVFVEASLGDRALNGLVGIVGAPEIDRINGYLAGREGAGA